MFSQWSVINHQERGEKFNLFFFLCVGGRIIMELDRLTSDHSITIYRVGVHYKFKKLEWSSLTDRTGTSEYRSNGKSLVMSLPVRRRV